MISYTAHMDEYGAVVITKTDEGILITKRSNGAIVMASSGFSVDALHATLDKIIKAIERGLI